MAGRLWLCGLALALSFAFGAGALRASTTELIISDPRSGAALHGFDPVAYFIEGRPQTGSQDHELRFRGLVWRFASAANRAAFEASPERYVPEFGGYDPVPLAANVPVPGNPMLFAIHDGKVFLFSTAANRTAFLEAPEGLNKTAAERWKAVRRLLVP